MYREFYCTTDNPNFPLADKRTISKYKRMKTVDSEGLFDESPNRPTKMEIEMEIEMEIGEAF
jgi:hypothetical protein